MYALARKCLFQLEPETAHAVALNSLQLAYRMRLSWCFKRPASRPVTLMGMTFPHTIGLAAGLDKNGDYIDALAMLGFGFIEIGTVTPRPQSGNPKPRLFRLIEQEALINRMGFNSKGIEYVLRRLEKTSYRGILGINIGKNRDTPNDNAIEDYLAGFRAFCQHASYITINISSPNTPGLRELQHDHALTPLLRALKHEQQRANNEYKRYVPLVVKISPDLSQAELESIAEILLNEKIDGVIATNTTLAREGVHPSPHANESGGLSGRPLHARSTQIIRELSTLLRKQIPIMASGGVMDEQTAREKFNAGASLLQVYTGFIYQGPGLVSRL